MRPVVHDDELRIRITSELLEEFRDYAYHVEERSMSVILRRLIREVISNAETE